MSEIQPLVSIIVPSYNRINTVTQTLDSILNQNCNFDFEIVVGDDFSFDGVRDDLLHYQVNYPDKIVLLFHDKNIGLGANWAKCVLHSRGKYIANCDNDDYWHNTTKLQLQVDFMERNPDYGLCHTDYRIHNRDTNNISEVICENSTVPNVSQLTAIMKGYFRCCNATVLYRKDVLMNYIDLNDYIKHQFTLQDWNTWMLIANHTKFYPMHISTATFGVETESITRPKDIEKLEARFIRERECYKYVCDKLPENYLYRAEDYDDYSNMVLLNLAYKQKKFVLASKYAKLLKRKSMKIFFAKNSISFLLFSNLLLFLKRVRSR